MMAFLFCICMYLIAFSPFLILVFIVIVGEVQGAIQVLTKRGRNHSSLVTSNSSGGDIHFDEMNIDELTSFLRRDYLMLKNEVTQCVNALHPSHIAEYRCINKRGRVKVLGYITKDKVVFEGATYYFPKETYET